MRLEVGQDEVFRPDAGDENAVVLGEPQKSEQKVYLVSQRALCLVQRRDAVVRPHPERGIARAVCEQQKAQDLALFAIGA